MKKINLYEVPEINSVQEMVILSSKTFGDKIALEDLNPTPISQLTYNQLFENIIKFGKVLAGLGLKERDHLAVIGENRVQWGVTYLTAMCFNYVIVPIDKNLSHNEILNILHESDAVAVVFSETFESLFREKGEALLKLKIYISMDLQRNEKGFYSMTQLMSRESAALNKLPHIEPDNLAEIIFTSGSLGRAKGVMLSQRNLASNLMAMTSMIKMYSSDRFLSVLPIHHTYECTCGFLCPVYTGATVFYARSLKTVVEDLQKVQATILLGVPLLYDKMFKKIHKGIKENKVKSRVVPPLLKITDVMQVLGWKNAKKKIFGELHEKFGGSIRIFIAGGAAPDPLVAKGLREFGFTFIQGYGLTETSPILALNQINNFKDNAAGIPLPGVEININNPDSDGIGEIYAKSKSVMLGYYKNPTLTADTFDDGWFKTGDIGFVDEDGFLHISGRKKNVIISKSGKNIFPEEIEDILNRNPFIQESLVFGEKDEKQDEIIAVQLVTDAEAFIEYSEKNNVSITPELIRQIISEAIKQANSELTSYKQIRKFYIRNKEFEKTTTQKIKRYLVSKEED